MFDAMCNWWILTSPTATVLNYAHAKGDVTLCDIQWLSDTSIFCKFKFFTGHTQTHKYTYVYWTVHHLTCSKLFSDTTLHQPNRTNTPVHTETEQYT